MKPTMNANNLPRRSHALISSCKVPFYFTSRNDGVFNSLHKSNCYRFRVTGWSWRKLPIYVHSCPTHQCTYAYVSSNLRTRKRQVIHLETSKDGHPLERKDFVHSRKHCSACLVHGVDAICNAAAKECIYFLSRLLRIFKNEPKCWTQMILSLGYLQRRGEWMYSPMVPWIARTTSEWIDTDTRKCGSIVVGHRVNVRGHPQRVSAQRGLGLVIQYLCLDRMWHVLIYSEQNCVLWRGPWFGPQYSGRDCFHFVILWLFIPTMIMEWVHCCKHIVGSVVFLAVFLLLAYCYLVDCSSDKINASSFAPLVSPA